MYTWVIRTAVLCAFVMPALTSCAGDDDTAAAASCMPGMQGLMLVGSPDDPCATAANPINPATNQPTCPTTMGFMIVPQCGAVGTPTAGTWECKCIEKPPVCGDGVRTGTEQCDGTNLNGASCGSLMPGSMGSLTCANCTYVTTGCMKAPTTMPPATMGGGQGG